LVDYLELTAHFRPDRDKNVWAVLTSSLHALNRVCADADRPGLEALVRDRVGPAAGELGWVPQPGESELISQLRGDLLRALGTLGNDAAVQARAAEVYAAYPREPAGGDASVLAVVIPTLAHVGEAARYDEFLGRFRSARTPQEEQRFLYALTGFRQRPLVEQTLARTLNGEIRTQDAPHVIRTLLMTVHGREPAWRFVQANWARVNEGYPPVGVRRMFEGLIGLAAPEEAADARELVAATQVR